VLERAFVRRAAASYGANVALAVISLVNVLVVSRSLGPGGRGAVAFLTTVAYLTGQVASLGVQQANSNIGGSEDERRPALATNSAVLALVLGAAGVAAVALLMAIVPAAAAGSSLVPRLLAFAAVPAVILGDYLASLLTAGYRFAVVNTVAVAAPLLTLGVNSALAAAGTITVTTAVAAWVLGQFAIALVCAAYVALAGEGYGSLDTGLLRRMTGFGLKTHAGRTLNFANYRLDQWLVGAIAGDRQLGLYSVAVAWSEGLFFLPNALATVQRPDLVRATPEEARRRALRAHALAQAVTVVLAAILFVAARPLCVGVFGSDFADSASQLRVLALGGFGVVALKQLGDALIAQRRPLRESAAVLVAFVATVVLDAILIPRHGGLGAAVASTIAYTAGGIAAAILFLTAIGRGVRAGRA
jgi:O-antigen/teichoic acid export membrane protein